MSVCKDCGREIDWLQTAEGRYIPVDPAPEFVIEGDGAEHFYTEEEGVLTGRLATPEEVQTREAKINTPLGFADCKWNGPSRTALNPSQEVEAAIKRVDAGFSTAEEETAQLTGGDYNRNIRKRAIEAARKREVDKIANPPPSGAGQTPPDPGGQEGGTGNAQ